MVVLPKGTLVKVGGMPFRLLADVETDGLQANYDLVAGDHPRVGVGAGHIEVCASSAPAEDCGCRTATSCAESR